MRTLAKFLQKISIQTILGSVSKLFHKTFRILFSDNWLEINLNEPEVDMIRIEDHQVFMLLEPLNKKKRISYQCHKSLNYDW